MTLDFHDALDIGGGGSGATNEWVFVKQRLTANIDYPTTEDAVLDVSQILPNDDYAYEVMFMGYVTTGTAVGNQVDIEVITDLTDGKSVMLGANAICVVSGKASIQGFNAILPLKQREVKVFHQSWCTGTYSLWVVGYKRM